MPDIPSTGADPAPVVGEPPPVEASGPRSGTLRAAPRVGRGRRPSHQVRTDILDAAGRILLAEGMAGFSIERVAAVAGASKVTIYKWWSSKGTLALEAYSSTVDDTLSVPDTGDIGADLTTQLLTYVGLLRDTPAGRVMAELIGEAQTDPALGATLRQVYSGPRRAVGLAALRAAQERGQIRADADLEVLVDQLWGACVYRLVMGDQPLTDAFARSVVRNLLHGVQADPASAADAEPH